MIIMGSVANSLARGSTMRIDSRDLAQRVLTPYPHLTITTNLHEVTIFVFLPCDPISYTLLLHDDDDVLYNTSGSSYCSTGGRPSLAYDFLFFFFWSKLRSILRIFLPET